jgi:hypothetical protein
MVFYVPLVVCMEMILRPATRAISMASTITALATTASAATIATAEAAPSNAARRHRAL